MQADFDDAPRIIRDLANDHGNLPVILWKDGNSVADIEAAFARSSTASAPSVETKIFEVTDVQRFDRDAYVARFEAWYRLVPNPKGPMVVDESPRYNSEDGYWFITASC